MGIALIYPIIAQIAGLKIRLCRSLESNPVSNEAYGNTFTKIFQNLARFVMSGRNQIFENFAARFDTLRTAPYKRWAGKMWTVFTIWDDNRQDFKSGKFQNMRFAVDRRVTVLCCSAEYGLLSGIHIVDSDLLAVVGHA